MCSITDTIYSTRSLVRAEGSQFCLLARLAGCSWSTSMTMLRSVDLFDAAASVVLCLSVLSCPRNVRRHRCLFLPALLFPEKSGFEWRNLERMCICGGIECVGLV